MSAPLRKDRPLRIYILPAAALFVFIHSFALLSPILLSLILILLMTLAVNPLVTRLRMLTGRRAVAAALLALVFALSLGLTGWAFFRPVKNSAGKMSEKLPSYWERFQKPLIKLEKQAGLAEQKLQAEVASEEDQKNAGKTPGEEKKPGEAKAPAATPSGHRVTRARRPRPQAAKPPEQPSFIRSGIAQLIQGAAGRFTKLAFDAAEIAVVLVTVFFGVTFTAMNPRPVFGTILSLVPEAHHTKAVTIMQRIALFMPRWALATLLAMSVVGTLVFLIMWPIFGFFDALVLGLIAGLLEAIPYVGPIFAAVPALMFALGEGQSTIMWVIAGYLAVQFLENNVISPLVMAGGMKLHPLAVMIAMLLCGAAFGVLGVIAAPPLVAIADILHEELYRKRFLPTTSPADLERMTRTVLHEKPVVK